MSVDRTRLVGLCAVALSLWSEKVAWSVRPGLVRISIDSYDLLVPLKENGVDIPNFYPLAWSGHVLFLGFPFARWVGRLPHDFDHDGWQAFVL
ncbi:hypothetical protein B0H66DRAFT_335838 [Apodospora peruviana]|uniref:Uncharacterized protein n=1 Tax=Apodospora peruviana TaxID=516989 RepID=A0AAE0HYI2_9PEZI|nr:hypothetical protein B0H66DRAFT_335838 [Apodospora peruviana]